MADRWTNGGLERTVCALQPGDMVDLEGDHFADPPGRETAHPEFEFEFEVVLAVGKERADVWRVDFESGFSCGFPPDHWLKVSAEAK